MLVNILMLANESARIFVKVFEVAAAMFVVIICLPITIPYTIFTFVNLFYKRFRGEI